MKPCSWIPQPTRSPSDSGRCRHSAPCGPSTPAVGNDLLADDAVPAGSAGRTYAELWARSGTGRAAGGDAAQAGAYLARRAVGIRPATGLHAPPAVHAHTCRRARVQVLQALPDRTAAPARIAERRARGRPARRGGGRRAGRGDLLGPGPRGPAEPEPDEQNEHAHRARIAPPPRAGESPPRARSSRRRPDCLRLRSA